jgi:hypothetical protein
VEGALFRPVKNNRTGHLDRHLDPASVYRNIVRKYGLETGISAEVNGLCVHSLRATAATNALSHDSDIAKVQEWLGHANVGAPCGSCIGLLGGSRSGGAIGSWSGFVGLPGVADTGTYLLLEFALPMPT